MEIKTGGQAAAQALIAHGIDTIFTLSGGHLNPIYVNLEDSDIRYFDTRHEQAAVWMAEAYGRFKRKPGVALVTAGPGFTNALTPIASAMMAATPLVLISGCVGLNMVEKLDLQDMRQLPVIEPMVKKAFVCHKPERVGEFIDMALREAASGRPGPVYLELPVDVLNGAPGDPNAVKIPVTKVESRIVDHVKVNQLAELIAGAKKPVLVAGSGAWYSDAGAVLTELVDKTHIPIFTASNGRGVVSDLHPNCFSGMSPIRPGASIHASFGTDLYILLGFRINLFSMFGDTINPEAKLVQVDIQPEEIGRNRRIDLPIHSDIRTLVEELNLIIDKKGNGETLKKQFAGWNDELKQGEAETLAQSQPLWESDANPIHPLRLSREIDNFLDRDDDILVTDGGDTTVWMNMTRTMRTAGHFLEYGLFGSLGGGLPNANAAKLLYPEKRVLLVTGDGSMGFNFMEYERAIKRGLSHVTVISNDQGWGMIRHSQVVKLGHSIDSVTHLGNVEYHKFVEAMGGVGFLVTEPGDIRPAIEEAFASGKTACVNVMVDPDVISPGSMALAQVGAYKM